MNSLRDERLLNGYWDFLPVLEDAGMVHAVPGEIPSQGWLEERMLVPGSWAKGVAGLDGAGFAQSSADQIWGAWDLYNNYDYPEAWDETNTAWYRRHFELVEKRDDRCYRLRFGGILREAWVFLNGHEVGHSVNGIMPLDCDVTEAVTAGDNELVVYVTDYRRNADGKVYTPNGADQMLAQKGIWQDVALRSLPRVRTCDVTIRTSVREHELWVGLVLSDGSDEKRDLQPALTVFDGDTPVLTFSGEPVSLAAGETTTVALAQPWSDYRVWSHHDPHLYHLEVVLKDGDTIVDRMTQRFGFREVWKEGPDLILNGDPVHMSGDWSHRLTMESLTDAYFKKWFGMLKDCNMNYIRTHTYPHPSSLLDLADEMGILVSLESGWHFGGGFALNEEALWQGALQHVRDVIARDKNHPSVILWSVGNEVRWSRN